MLAYFALSTVNSLTGANIYRNFRYSITFLLIREYASLTSRNSNHAVIILFWREVSNQILSENLMITKWIDIEIVKSYNPWIDGKKWMNKNNNSSGLNSKSLNKCFKSCIFGICTQKHSINKSKPLSQHMH